MFYAPAARKFFLQDSAELIRLTKKKTFLKFSNLVDIFNFHHEWVREFLRLVQRAHRAAQEAPLGGQDGSLGDQEPLQIA